MTELQVELQPSRAASEPQPHYLYTLHHGGIRNGAALFVGITNDPDRTGGRHQRRTQCGSLVLEILSLVDTPRAERQANRLKLDFLRANPKTHRSARRFYSWLRWQHGRRALTCPAAASPQPPPSNSHPPFTIFVTHHQEVDE